MPAGNEDIGHLTGADKRVTNNNNNTITREQRRNKKHTTDKPESNRSEISAVRTSISSGHSSGKNVVEDDTFNSCCSDTDFLKSLIARLIDVDTSSLADSDVVVSKSEIVYLCQLAVKSFLSQPSLLQLDDNTLPVTICADLHGQFQDLKLIMRECGYPPEKAWLFLGDYVDRGKRGVEVVCLLFALKVAYSNKCFMLRGNHEDYNTSMVYGFYDECLQKYGDSDKHLVWLSFVNVFNCMPLVALVGERVLAMHGGISPYINNLDNLTEIKRPTMIPLWGLTCDLVWSDPGAARSGWSTSMRSVSFSYDDSIIEQFCAKHKIDLIVRGHQIHDSWSNRGYNMTKNCKLVTIFSAPNYLGGGSTAAVLNISKEMECKFELFRPKKGKRTKTRSKRQKHST